MAKLIIHGGAGSREGNHVKSVGYAKRVRQIVSASFSVLLRRGARGYRYGLIALDRNGRHIVGETPGVTTIYAVGDGENITTFNV
jgi:hypothetical protein